MGVNPIEVNKYIYLVFTTPLFLVPLRPKYLPQHSIRERPQPMPSLYVTDQASHTITTRRSQKTITNIRVPNSVLSARQRLQYYDTITHEDHHLRVFT